MAALFHLLFTSSAHHLKFLFIYLLIFVGCFVPVVLEARMSVPVGLFGQMSI